MVFLKRHKSLTRHVYKRKVESKRERVQEDGEEIAEERKHLHFLFPNDVSNMHCPFFLSVTIVPPVLFAIVEIWRHCYCVISCMRTTTQSEESLMKIWYSLSLSLIYLVSFSFLLFTFRSLFFLFLFPFFFLTCFMVWRNSK